MAESHAMFWSSDTLIKRLASLVDPFDPARVDCAAYTLSVGSEVYVSPNDEAVDRETVTVRQLAQGGAFAIPPGQFAFLITEEIVTVPDDALAFISIRAKIKFCGLVNVSGFHVDPGYKGQLTFAVFNAGPRPVHLKQGQPIFLIWYASLDRESTSKKEGSVKRDLDPKLITGIAGEVQSFAGLSEKIENVKNDLTESIHSVEKSLSRFQTLGYILMIITVGLVVAWLSQFLPKSTQANAPHRPLTASSAEQTGEFRPDQNPEAIEKTAPRTTDGDASSPKHR